MKHLIFLKNQPGNYGTRRYFLVELPYQSGAGHEQAGRRPVIVVQTDALTVHLPTIMVVPMTTNLRRLGLPYTLRVDPSPSNGLTHPRFF